MKKYEQKVIDELWDDARVWRFLDFYATDGPDVRAPDNKGRTLAETIAGHANSGRFVGLLHAH